MGTMLLQFSRLSGFRTITTCSPHNISLVKSYGAEFVFDYNSPSSISEIKQLLDRSGGEVRHCVDCISTEASAKYCAEIIARGGEYSSIGLATSPRTDLISHQTLGYSFLGEEYTQFGVTHPANLEDLEFSTRFAEVAQALMANAKIKAHSLDVRDGGFEAVERGIADLRQKKVSGKKIVIRVGEE
jgi:NADPH:quinone reductase-like Zn-dependent oxidoreductase